MIGAQLVGDVLANYPRRLNHRDLLVAVRMAHTARDTPSATAEAGLYYAGWIPLAQVLGYDVLDLDPDADPDTRAKIENGRETARTSVKRAIANLKAVGVIESIGGNPGGGRTQTYRVLPHRTGRTHQPPLVGTPGVPTNRPY